MAARTFLLEIITPERTFFTGEVQEAIIPGLDGMFGILPGHVPMIGGLAIGIVRIRQDGKWREASCSQGFLRIGPEHTLILAQTMEWPEEVDIKLAQEQIEIAQEKLRQQASMREYVETQNTLAKALTRLQLGAHRNINH